MPPAPLNVLNRNGFGSLNLLLKQLVSAPEIREQFSEFTLSLILAFDISVDFSDVFTDKCNVWLLTRARDS